MASPVRILAIVPYEGMKQLMLRLAGEFPEVELDIFVSNMEKAVELARSSFSARYDVILSRGGTALLLRQLSLPVIEIDISLYDILCALKLSDGVTGRAAMVAYANIASSAQLLCGLLGSDIDIRTVDTPAELEPTLRRLQAEAYTTVLCDVTASMIARQLGMNAILITSGTDSIRRAIQTACAFCREQSRLKRENQFFREVLRGPMTQIAVFTETGDLFFSSAETPSPELLDMLRRELPECIREPERRVIRTLNRMTYSIYARRVTAGPDVYTAFYFELKKAPPVPSQAGIRFCSLQEAEKAFYDSIFSFLLIHLPLQDDIRQLSESAAPVLISGEQGTGRNEAATRLYMQGPLRNASLVTITCSLVNEKSLDFLLAHHNSPLLESGCTLYFSDVDALTAEQRRRLIAAMLETDVCRRSRVFFSCLCGQGEQVSPAGAEFLNQLNCLSLRLPPLREASTSIPTLLNLALSQLNTNLQTPVLGAEPEAVRLLECFSWPHNYSQFQRVVDQLATVSHQIITAEDVRQVLQKESCAVVPSTGPENGSAPIDLSKPLSDISRQVALYVLQETGGNHTAAAKRLGISRTTFWRLVKSS